MSNGKLRALAGLSSEYIGMLEKAGYTRCCDVLTCPPETIGNILDVPLCEVASFIQRVSVAMVGPRVTLASRSPRGSLQTGLPSIDHAFGGGVPGGMVVEVAGPPGAGKTQFALTITARSSSAVASVEGGPVIYIDTERKFSAMRLREILVARGWEAEQAAPQVHVRHVVTLRDFTELTNELELQVVETGARLVVLDSLAALIRPESISAVDRSQLLVTLASLFKAIAERYGVLFLVTNHVIGHGGAVAALGNTWHHCVNVRFVLEASTGLGGQQSTRTLHLSKSPACDNLRVVYAITAGGFVEVASQL